MREPTVKTPVVPCRSRKWPMPIRVLAWVAVPLAAAGSSPASGQFFDLDGSQLLTQSSFQLFGAGPQEDARFGHSLAVGDFDCDGRDDLAIGVPWHDVLDLDQFPAPVSIPDAGEVYVLYATASGLLPLASDVFDESRLFGGVVEADDHFGQVLASGSFFDGDCDDLVIGQPDEDDGTLEDSGAVFVIPGTPAGLDLDGGLVITQEGSVAGIVEAGDRFGAALAVGDVDGDDHRELVVGAPGERLNDGAGEGAVWVFHGADFGLDLANGPSWRQLLTPDTTGLPDTGEPGDLFGFSLALCDGDGDGFDDLWIGSPGESDEQAPLLTVRGLLPVADAGAVYAVAGSESGPDPLDDPQQFFGFGRSDFDYFGWSMAAGHSHPSPYCSVAVGAPFTDDDPVLDAGTAQIFVFGDPKGVQRLSIHQDDFSETMEESDLFAFSVAFGDFDGGTQSEVVFGAWGEDLGDPPGGEGVIHVWSVNGPDRGDDVLATYRQDDFSGRDSAPGRRFGYALAAGDFDGDGFDDLAVGVPSQDVDSGGQIVGNAGAVQILFSSGLFRNGFESGDLSRWSATMP